MRKIVEIRDSNWYLFTYFSLAAFIAGGMIADTYGPTPTFYSCVIFVFVSLPLAVSPFIEYFCDIDSQRSGKHSGQDDRSGH